jgi:hypothetical protein
LWDEEDTNEKPDEELHVRKKRRNILPQIVVDTVSVISLSLSTAARLGCTLFSVATDPSTISWFTSSTPGPKNGEGKSEVRVERTTTKSGTQLDNDEETISSRKSQMDFKADTFQSIKQRDLNERKSERTAPIFELSNGQTILSRKSQTDFKAETNTVNSNEIRNSNRSPELVRTGVTNDYQTPVSGNVSSKSFDFGEIRKAKGIPKSSELVFETGDKPFVFGNGIEKTIGLKSPVPQSISFKSPEARSEVGFTTPTTENRNSKGMLDYLQNAREKNDELLNNQLYFSNRSQKMGKSNYRNPSIEEINGTKK